MDKRHVRICQNCTQVHILISFQLPQEELQVVQLSGQ